MHMHKSTTSAFVHTVFFGT